MLVKNGKEYAALKAHVQKSGDDYSVDLDEQAVSAFPGQEDGGWRRRQGR